MDVYHVITLPDSGLAPAASSPVSAVDIDDAVTAAVRDCPPDRFVVAVCLSGYEVPAADELYRAEG